ncbi:MAG: hypothetical protein WAK24_10220 [Candidatus Acidiferrales bacterium]
MSPKLFGITFSDAEGTQNSGSSAPAEVAARWTEARLAYPLYAALAAQFELAPAPYPAGELPAPRPTRDVFDRDLQWFDAIDEKVRAFQIRQLPPEVLNASEEALRAFIQRLLKRPGKTNADRDKIDLLLVQYFALCAPEELYREEIKLADVARVLQPVLIEADAAPLDWCEPLEQILKTLDGCHSLRDMMEHGLLEQGRLLKDSAGDMFYDPAALVAFCRFNFSLRRAFIRMLHADLNAVKTAVDTLEAAGVKSVDCRRAGFSAAENTARLRYYSENWRQPFHKDYTESSVSRAFEQLLALRADLEEAVARMHGGFSPAAGSLAPSKLSPRPELATAGNGAEIKSGATLANPSPRMPLDLAGIGEPAPVNRSPVSKVSGTPNQQAKSAPESNVPPTDAAEVEKCLEAIWEQLIAAPPSRGRSMSTVVLQDTKVLLSSWEVAAFVAQGDQEAEDLRRAVVARAILSVAMDQRKRSGEENALASALNHARGEVSYFQGRVEAAKRSKNTEAAVNLGISTKRLLSTIEEAEKLQP